MQKLLDSVNSHFGKGYQNFQKSYSMPFDEKTQFLYLSLHFYYYFCSQRGQVVSASNMEMAVSSENFVSGGVRIPLMLQLIFQISTQYKISKGVGLNH